jgi:hypothetical protein
VGDGGLGELSFKGSEGLTSKEKSGQGPPKAHGKKLMAVHTIKINPNIWADILKLVIVRQTIILYSDECTTDQSVGKVLSKQIVQPFISSFGR